MFLSGILYHGMIKTVLDLILDNKIELYVSPKLITEVLEKLQELGADVQSLGETLLFLQDKGIYTIPNVKIDTCRDPKDNFALELSEASNADYLITRDKDLFELDNHMWKNTEIVKPEVFLPLLRSIKLLD